MTTEDSQELVITRIFDAPRELVYQAFTDPDQLAQWFGPVGFSVPRETVEIDARPGGVQRFVMVSDSDPAMTSPVDARFTEVIKNELLVGIESVSPDGSGDADGTGSMRMRLEFHDEEGGRTRLVLRQGPLPVEVMDMAREGWLSSFTKLDQALAP
jgi:uncharacterized protein YndB with AHSA1/START domain